MRWKFWERRAVPTWNTTQGTAGFHAIFGGGPTAAGLYVTPETALEVPAIFGCLQVLSQDVARTPIKFRRVVGESMVDAVDHDLWEILSSLPNPEQTAYQVKFALQWQLLQYGRAYAEIVRTDGRISALWPLDAARMRVDRDEQRRKRWTYTSGGQTHTWLFDPSRPPIFELTHETPLARCKDLVGLALALLTYQSTFFANGSRPAGILQAPGAISTEIAQRLKEYWRLTYQGATQAHQVAVLGDGLEFKPIAFANNDSQMIEAVAAVTQAIAGTFRIPPWKIGLMEQTTYSNMASGELAYVSSTLDPFYQCWEDAIRRDLLTHRQYAQFSVTFDRNALIRSDVQAQHAALATGIQAGFYSQNDARRALGLNPIADGDRYRINSALVPVEDKAHVTAA